MSDVALSTPYWDYVVDHRQSASGKVRQYHFVRPLDSVMVVPRLADGRFVMVRQLRVPVRQLSLEFPGGGVRPGEEPEAAARRELKEETGYEAGTIRQLGLLNPCNGLSSETCTIYLADDLIGGVAIPDETEELEVLTLAASEIAAEFRSGQPLDGVAVAAWFLFNSEELARPTPTTEGH
jgi:ADP-ribose pyrophosphatase